MRTPEQDHASLEIELRKLEERHSWDDAPAAVKRRMRTIKNRLSAKKSREQARDYVDKLEQSVRMLSNESDTLARRLAIAEAENKILQQVGGRCHGLATGSNADIDTANNDDDAGAMTAAPASTTASDGGGGQDEPAVPSKPSLQLDALLLLFQTVAASRETYPTTPSATPGGGPRRNGSACAPSPSTSHLLRVRATLSKRLTKERLMGSSFRSGAGLAAASPEAKARARRARVLRGLRVTRSLRMRTAPRASP